MMVENIVRGSHAYYIVWSDERANCMVYLVSPCNWQTERDNQASKLDPEILSLQAMLAQSRRKFGEKNRAC